MNFFFFFFFVPKPAHALVVSKKNKKNERNAISLYCLIVLKVINFIPTTVFFNIFEPLDLINENKNRVLHMWKQFDDDVSIFLAASFIFLGIAFVFNIKCYSGKEHGCVVDTGKCEKLPSAMFDWRFVTFSAWF